MDNALLDAKDEAFFLRGMMSFSSRDLIDETPTEITFADIDRIMKKHEESREKAKRTTKSTQSVEKGRACTHTLEY